MTDNQLDYVAPLTCRKCARLADFIDSHREQKPDWHNNPVPSFGPITAYGPILTFFEILAFESIKAVLCIIYFPLKSL